MGNGDDTGNGMKIYFYSSGTYKHIPKINFFRLDKKHVLFINKF